MNTTCQQHSFRGGLLLVLVAASITQAAEDDANSAQPAPPEEGPVHLIAVDQDGNPVEGAIGGFIAYRRHEGERPWKFISNPDNLRTDELGALHLASGAHRLRHSTIVIWHRQRELVGLKLAQGEELEPGAPIQVELQPACHVVGKLTCEQLAERKRDIGWTIVQVHRGDERPMYSMSEDGEYEFWLPPGEYELQAYGTYGHEVRRSIVVRKVARKLNVDVIDLPATSLALLLGEKAPELRGISEWVGEPVKLEDLRGKYVLLEFWGHWCGPCIQLMPKLFEIADTVSNDDLVIIGVHVGRSPSEPADTVEQYESAIAETRRELWNGQSLPFPNALMTSEPTPLVGADELARCATAADYAVLGYPTTILIDRDGHVVGEVGEYVHSDEKRPKLIELVTGGRKQLDDD